MDKRKRPGRPSKNKSRNTQNPSFSKGSGKKRRPAGKSAAAQPAAPGGRGGAAGGQKGGDSTVSHPPKGERGGEIRRHSGDLWIYGIHAASAALENPRRRVRQVVAAPRLAETARALIEARQAATPGDRRPVDLVIAEPAEYERQLHGDVTQGIAVLAAPLPPVSLEDVLDRLAGDGAGPARLVALDQVSDPHNLGAVLRSAAVFGASAVIVPDRGSPSESGTLAKTASGALERVPIARVPNLSRALKLMQSENILTVGLDERGESALWETDLGRDLCLVFGAEGKGLRRLTRETCDLLARLDPAAGGFASLNVSNAAAIALYEATRQNQR